MYHSLFDLAIISLEITMVSRGFKEKTSRLNWDALSVMNYFILFQLETSMLLVSICLPLQEQLPLLLPQHL